MTYIVKSLFYLIVFIPSIICSQDKALPYLRDVTLKCVVVFDNSKKIYSYSYSIWNGITNTAEINVFEIDISRDTMNTLPLDGKGLQFKNSRFENSYKRWDYVTLNSTVAVSFPALPQYGEAGLTVRKTVSLSAKVIKQGDEVKGFSIASKGLPGIRKFTAFPYYDVVDYYPSIDDVNDPDSLMERMQRDEDSISFHGYTIGPTAPPLNFVATVWCDTLLSYTRQSVSLGWLKEKRDDDCDEDEQPNDGVSKNIEKRIEKAKKELMKSDSVKARKELEKLVKKVEKIYKKSEEAERKKHDSDITMTSEAYALLKYNTEYLIERLPEKKSKKGGNE